MTDTPASPNADQIAYWNSVVAERWARRQAEIDTMMAEVTAALLGAARIGPGAPLRIGDIGCGSGETALLAARFGHDVTGLDVSARLLELARERAVQAGLRTVSFIEADVSRTVIDPPFDLIVSRFGVMFFADPVKAFAAIARMTVPGGRIVFACWRAPELNEWVTVPTGALEGLAPPGSAPAPADAPGPFAFADGTRVRRILQAAGFSAVTLTPVDVSMVMGGVGVEAAAAFLSEIGPAARAIADLPQERRPEVAERLKAAIAPRMAGDRLSLRGAVWIVEALRG